MIFSGKPNPHILDRGSRRQMEGPYRQGGEGLLGIEGSAGAAAAAAAIILSGA
jgi:hypothetical protein